MAAAKEKDKKLEEEARNFTALFKERFDNASQLYLTKHHAGLIAAETRDAMEGENYRL